MASIFPLLFHTLGQSNLTAKRLAEPLILQEPYVIQWLCLSSFFVNLQAFPILLSRHVFTLDYSRSVHFLTLCIKLFQVYGLANLFQRKYFTLDNSE